MRMTPKTFELFVPGLVLALAMMGSSTSHAVEPPEIDATEAAASRAVDQGLVGAVFGQVSIKDGDTERESGFAGLRRIGSTDALNGRESFIIGSNTKAMTAVVAARLIERGVLRWDSTIGEAIPELQPSMRADYREVTVEQLLAHRGGVLAMTGGEDLQRFSNFLVTYTDALPQTLVEKRRFFANWLLTQPPPSGVIPRQDFYYSNSGYTLDAAMLEALTGKTY